MRWELTRLAIWWHQKASGHRTRTFFRSSPIIVQCAECEKDWVMR